MKDAFLHIANTVISISFSGYVGYRLGLAADKRKRREEAGARLQEFERAKKLMPKLIEEMSEDLAKHPSNREFLVLDSERDNVMGSGSAIAYFRTEHSELNENLHVLENLGLIRNVTTGNTLRYRMTEEFVELIGIL